MAAPLVPAAAPTLLHASSTQPTGTTASIWQAPLVPLALAATAGTLLDRHLGIPLTFSLLTAAAGLVAWLLTASAGPPRLALWYLWAAVAALMAAHHHTQRDVYADDDIGHRATSEPRPVLVRGSVEREPVLIQAPPRDPLRARQPVGSVQFVLRVRQVMDRDDWQPASGLAQVLVRGPVPDLHGGDEVEAVGNLSAPQTPGNPGEFDYADFLRDQHVRALLVVRPGPDSVIVTERRWQWNSGGLLALVRGSGQRLFAEALPEPQAGLAMALLLGEGSTLTRADWQKYIRTGVIHVLAISGQHMVVLAGFVWMILRLGGMRRRRGGLIVTLLLVSYTLVVGGRPPVLRAAVMVCSFCGGFLLKRPVLLPNAFALAWLLVALLNPTDLFNWGCLFSFLAVAVLCWGVQHWWTPGPPDAVAELIWQTRPWWQKALLWTGKQILVSYAVTLAVWLALLPLTASWTHLVSPVSVLIGPPLLFLTSVALLAGFVVLAIAPWFWPGAQPAVWVLNGSLWGCDALVTSADGWPNAYGYVADVPGWWLWVFYPALLAFLMTPRLRRHWRAAALLAAVWLCVGLVAMLRWPPGELRCTFVAVGHGGCTVIETPDGRVLLYDAGAISGPDVTARHIAPFLWSCGIRRIDEVFLSHADLDHFNGIPALLERFSVGQVSMTPSFAQRDTPGVDATLQALERQRVPLRVIKAGDRLRAGDVDIEVLHPPKVGPPGNENTRSLVLRVRHGGLALLLTGDLEGVGLEMVRRLPPRAVDVLMVPHHGSKAVDHAALLKWTGPGVAVACQVPPRNRVTEEAYEAAGVRFLSTATHGAVTIRGDGGRFVVETYRTRQRWWLRASFD